MSDASLDLALTVLDRQLVDRDGHNCGRVDDIELSGGPGEPLTVEALVVGTGAWRGRMRSRFGRLVSRVGGDRSVDVPWTEVREITHVVKLRGRGAEWGLGGGDRRAARWVQRIPRA